VDNAPRAEKEEALEKRVIEGVQCGAGEAEYGDQRVSVRDAQSTRPDAEQDDPDVLHAVEREKPLDIMLREGPHDPQDPGDRAERQHHPTPPGRRRTEETIAQQPIDPILMTTPDIRPTQAAP
jgi:hypothetical protein